MLFTISNIFREHLILQELGKFNFIINFIPNELEKYLSFSLNNKLFFIDSFQFFSFSCSLVKNLGENDFKHLKCSIRFSQIRSSGVILKVEGLNYLVSKETRPWLGPTGIEKFSKLDPLDWLKLTPNSKIFHFHKTRICRNKETHMLCNQKWYFQKSPILN